MTVPGAESIRWKFLLATSVSLTLVFLVTGFVIERRAIGIATASLESEARGSLRGYESLWQARGDLLASVSLALSGMSDVRAAFGTRDEATIRDTAGERWAKLSSENAVFAVTSPQGRVIGSFGERPLASPEGRIDAVLAAAARFPAQSRGFVLHAGALQQVVITPVYVDSPSGPVLLSVLVAGYSVDRQLAARLKEATGGSEFVFTAAGQVVASTLPAEAIAELQPALVATSPESGRIHGRRGDYVALRRALTDVDGKPAGDLWILKSFESAQRAVAVLRRDLALVWSGALLVSLAFAWALAQRLLRPIAALDAAAAEVSRQNYSHRVTVSTRDELGRLGAAFNRMCDSLEVAERKLIRQERLATISRLTGSLVHDLRNPLAAIYAGSEMLVDSELPAQQVRRLAGNIHRSSAHIQSILDELVEVSRGRQSKAETCSVDDIVDSAWEFVAARADQAQVDLCRKLPPGIVIEVERRRIERVFVNLFSNSIEAMPDGGTLTVTAHKDWNDVWVYVEDTGPGIDAAIVPRLFEPFAASGKKGGMGLGLALSRQSVVENLGDMGADPAYVRGARFWLRLPAGPAAGNGATAP